VNGQGGQGGWQQTGGHFNDNHHGGQNSRGQGKVILSGIIVIY
jgi:hypothetical protein